MSMIRRAPLSPADRRECYRNLVQWVASRARPGSAPAGEQQDDAARRAGISVDAVVAGRESRLG
jgi:hypothetical protein